MDAAEIASVALAFFLDLLKGVPSGEPLSILFVALVALGVFRLALPTRVWFVAKSLILIGLFGYYMYLASNVIASRFGHDASIYLRGAAAALCGVFGVMAAQRMLADAPAATTRAGLAMRPASSYHYNAHAPSTNKLARRAGGAFMNVFQPGREQTLPTVLGFAFVAEFGVFSTGVIWPPKSWIVGAGFLLIFLAGAALYILATYEKKTRGLVRLAITTVAALALALLFEILWYETSPTLALTHTYFFTSTGLIATATAVGFSLVVQGH